MQKPSAGRKQCRAISCTVQNFAYLKNSRSARKFYTCANFFCFPFSAQNDPVLYISNFTLDVILMPSYVYVISFVTEHYISLVKLVANQSIFQHIDETFGSSFPVFLLLSHFLSFSRHPNTP